MKIKFIATELVDTAVDFVSLVRHGANRAPFKIVKQESLRLNGRSRARARLDQAIQDLGTSFEGKKRMRKLEEPETTDQTMSGKERELRVRRRDKVDFLKAKVRALQIRLEEHWLNAQPDAEGMRVQRRLLDQIEDVKTDLAALADPGSDPMEKSSVFFQRGGRSEFLRADLRLDPLGIRESPTISKAERDALKNTGLLGTLSNGSSDEVRKQKAAFDFGSGMKV